MQWLSYFNPSSPTVTFIFYFSIMQFIFFLSFLFFLSLPFSVLAGWGYVCHTQVSYWVMFGAVKITPVAIASNLWYTREFILVSSKQYWKTVPRGRISWNKWFQVPALQCTVCHCWKWHIELGRQMSDMGIGTTLWAQSEQYFPFLSLQLHRVLPWSAGSEVTWQRALITVCDTRNHYHPQWTQELLGASPDWNHQALSGELP